MKPISSTRFPLRCQVDLIDLRDMSEEQNKSDSGVLYKWLLVYQDHFTKYILLRPLKHKSADEVAEVIFVNSVHLIYYTVITVGSFPIQRYSLSLINGKWTSTKIVHGKPCHPESQGSVKRANREIKNALGFIMRGNDNDISWVKYLKRVNCQKDTTHHSSLGLIPYKALFNHPLEY